jgi:hypothetical protein
MITHRCKGSLKNGCSIRFMKEIFRDEPDWHIGCMQFDSEWGEYYMTYFPTHISYCPFCGKKLEVKE